MHVTPPVLPLLFFWPQAWEILVLQPGTEPRHLHWNTVLTTREGPHLEFSIKGMLSFSNKSGNRRQYLRVNDVTVCFFHLQLLWNFTTGNKKQHVGSVCYLSRMFCLHCTERPAHPYHHESLDCRKTGKENTWFTEPPMASLTQFQTSRVLEFTTKS